MPPTSPTPFPFSSVLCAVDFSSHSRVALRYAAAVATRGKGSVSVLYVTDPLLAAAAARAYDEAALAGESARELARFIERAVGTRQTGVTIRGTVALGQPAQEIQRAARRGGADLIVVGSEGLSGASRLFFGSTTARLLAEAELPVLAVPPQQGARSRLAGWPAPRILAAIDLGRTAARDVAATAAIARAFDVDLGLVHVVQKTRMPGWLSLGAAGHDRERAADARKRLQRLAAAAGVPADSVHISVGDPAEQVAALAADDGAGLVILTLRGGDRLFGDRKGATTYGVVCRANTPVLALPEGWEPARGGRRR